MILLALSLPHICTHISQGGHFNLLFVPADRELEGNVLGIEMHHRAPSHARVLKLKERQAKKGKKKKKKDGDGDDVDDDDVDDDDAYATFSTTSAAPTKASHTHAHSHTLSLSLISSLDNLFSSCISDVLASRRVTQWWERLV